MVAQVTVQNEASIAQLNSADFIVKFGFDPPIIYNAISTAWSLASSMTTNYPKTYQGTTLWAEFVKHFRQGLKGWTAQSIKNFDLTVNPSEDKAIVIMGGNKATGLLGDAIPSTKNPKGIMTLQLIENNKQLMLFPEMEAKSQLKDGCQNWVLLYHRTDNEIRLEISLPSDITDGRIDTWLERNILPSYPINAAMDLDFEELPIIDFDIE